MDRRAVDRGALQKLLPGSKRLSILLGTALIALAVARCSRRKAGFVLEAWEPG